MFYFTRRDYLLYSAYPVFFIDSLSQSLSITQHHTIDALIHRLDSLPAAPSVQEESAAKGLMQRLVPTRADHENSLVALYLLLDPYCFVSSIRCCKYHKKGYDSP